MPSKTTPFESQTTPKARLEDSRVSLILEYLNYLGRDLYRANINRTLLEMARDLNLVGIARTPEKPINAGLLFFNERPEKFFNGARIVFVDKHNLDGKSMTEKVFTGPIYFQLNSALSFIRN